MLCPILITRSIQAESVKGGKELVSTTFIARFEGGFEKMINRKEWQVKGLLRDCDTGNVVLGISECTLYFKNWAQVPTFGKWDLHYPSNCVIPKEITDCF